jgi:hypothetical protein
MNRPARARRRAGAVLVGLLALGSLQATLAICGIVWRSRVLSWDNPATQVVEEVASTVVPVTDPSRLAAEHLAAALRASVRARASKDRGRVESAALLQSVTRAPPA